MFEISTRAPDLDVAVRKGVGLPFLAMFERSLCLDDASHSRSRHFPFPSRLARPLSDTSLSNKEDDQKSFKVIKQKATTSNLESQHGWSTVLPSLSSSSPQLCPSPAPPPPATPLPAASFALPYATAFAHTGATAGCDRILESMRTCSISASRSCSGVGEEVEGMERMGWSSEVYILAAVKVGRRRKEGRGSRVSSSPDVSSPRV